jgi:NAD-dependent deacetylase
MTMETIRIGAEDRVFVLTGAGISAESGLPTFRASDGLWEGHRIEDVCTPEALERNPGLVWEFYSARRTALKTAENVDDLHERAGSVRLVHMHGELAKSRCEAECGTEPVEDRMVYKDLSAVGRCTCGARMRPHIVFFGEVPLEMGRIQLAIEKATLMVVVGTSGSVYPAANFVHWARQAGARTVYVGPERPLNASAFTHVVEGKAGEVLPGMFECSS